MSLPEKRPSISAFERRLHVLARASDVARTVLESMEPESDTDLEVLIYEGYGNLIGQFNEFTESSVHSGLAPKAIELKTLLKGRVLPSLDELTAREVVKGIKVSRELMLKGQVNKILRKHSQLVPKAEIDNAIGAPSLDTSPEALAIGTAGHIIERIIMSHMQNQGVDTSKWVKDQVLGALVEMALLEHAKNYTYGGEDDGLFDYFTTPPSDKPGAGLGWRKPKDVEQVLSNYQEVEGKKKTALIDTIRTVYADDEEAELITEIMHRPYQEALSYTFTRLVGGYETDIDQESIRNLVFRILPELLGFHRSSELLNAEKAAVDFLKKDFGGPLSAESEQSLDDYDTIADVDSDRPIDKLDDIAKNTGRLIAKSQLFLASDRLGSYESALYDIISIYGSFKSHDPVILKFIEDEYHRINTILDVG